MENGAIREEEKRLKTSIIANLETKFVDQFEKWKERADVFNSIVVDYNKANNRRLKPLTYDQFCKLFVNGSKALLDEYIKMHEIIPCKEELGMIKEGMEGDNADAFKQRYTALLGEKYAVVKMTLARIWDGYVFKHMVCARYGSQHYNGMLEVKNDVNAD